MFKKILITFIMFFGLYSIFSANNYSYDLLKPTLLLIFAISFPIMFAFIICFVIWYITWNKLK